MALTIEQVSFKLCYYDKRNPESIERGSPLRKNQSCYCDNCFYGRTPLAEELLKLIPVAEGAAHALSYLADLNGQDYLGDGSVAAKDMDQRAKALQGSLYKALNP